MDGRSGEGKSIVLSVTLYSDLRESSRADHLRNNVEVVQERAEAQEIRRVREKGGELCYGG